MAEFRFANPEALLWILTLPLLVALSYYSLKSTRKRLERFIPEFRWPQLIRGGGPSGLSAAMVWQLLACCFFALALARPQANPQVEEHLSQSLDIMILLDVSRSMDAEDVAPSRLKKAKHSISYLLDELNGDRVGVVVFAGSSILLSPLTSDYEIIRTYLQNADSTIFSNQGTNFENALALAEKALKRGGANVGDKEIPQTIIVMSDGEETRGQLANTAKDLFSKGFKIFSIGFGTEKGVPIPLRDAKGELSGYKKDSSGETVISKLQVAALKTLAESGGGTFYYDSLDKAEIKAILSQMKNMERSDKKSIQAKVYTEYFWYPLVCGIVLLLFSTIGNLRFLFKASLIFVITFLGESSASAAWWRDGKYNSHLNAISNSEPESAAQNESTLTELQANDPNSPELAYNLSTLQMKNNPKVIRKPSIELTGDLALAYQFNLAGRAAKAGEKPSAIAQYASLAESLTKKQNPSKFESALLEQAKKNIELLSQKNQDQQNQNSKNSDSKNNDSGDDKKNQDNSSDDQKKDSKENKKEEDNQDPNSKNNSEKKNQSSKDNSKESDPADKGEQDKKQETDQDKENQQQSNYQQPRRKKFMDRQDLTESDAKRILESLKAQEGKLQKDFIKKQEKGKKFDYDDSPEKDW